MGVVEETETAGGEIATAVDTETVGGTETAEDTETVGDTGTVWDTVTVGDTGTVGVVAERKRSSWRRWGKP